MADRRRTLQILRQAGTLAGVLGAAGVTAAALRGWFSSRTANAARTYEVAHSQAEWKARLTPAAFSVLRRGGTEPPHSSPLNREHRVGTYACAGCAWPLYSSATKFESGTGWPSFWAPLAGAVDELDDTRFFLRRTEAVCHRCGGHLGHVFEDGPAPTGLRHCINGVALEFFPA